VPLAHVLAHYRLPFAQEELGSPALAFVRTACALLALDARCTDAVAVLRRQLLKLLKVREFSQAADFKEACLALTLPDVICRWAAAEGEGGGEELGGVIIHMKIDGDDERCVLRYVMPDLICCWTATDRWELERVRLGGGWHHRELDKFWSHAFVRLIAASEKAWPPFIQLGMTRW